LAVTPIVTAAAASTRDPSEANVRGVHASAQEVEPSRADDARHFHLHGGGQAELTFGYVPAVLLGTTARLEVLDVSQQIVHSAFAVGFSALRPTERSVGDASASLTWTLGQLVACPVHFGLSQSVSLLPCSRVDVGRLNAVGQNIANARDRNLLWLSAGVLAKFMWIPMPPLVVDLEGAALFPLTSYEFVFEPSSVLYGAPWIGFSTSVGLGIMFL
jgi:hypothetical protein